MFSSEPKTFRDAVKPLLYFNCYIGMGAFRLPNQNRNKYLLMKLHTIIVTLVNWILIYMTFSSRREVVDVDNVSSSVLIMSRILIYANSCIAMIAPFLVWFRRRLTRDCEQQILIFDETYQTFLGARNEYRKEYNLLICQIVAIVVVMLLVGTCDCILILEIEPPETNIQSIFTTWIVEQSAIHYPILVMLVLSVNFCTFVRYFGKKFRDLNASLLRLVEKPSISRSGKELSIIPESLTRRTSGNEVKNMEVESLITDKHYFLREHRKAHSELCELSRKINLAFGIQNLLFTGVSFVMITGLSYNIYCAFTLENLTNGKLVEVISSALWTAIYVFKIWVVNDTCWRVSNEAERTGEVMYELLDSRVDKELQREIQEFGVQMLHNPVRFNACGFFTLDYTFVQGVIGSITTYLVILIQMSPSSTSNAAIARNETENFSESRAGDTGIC